MGLYSFALPLAPSCPLLPPLAPSCPLPLGMAVCARDQVRDFFLGYRKVALEPTEVIASVHVPLPAEGSFSFVQPYKQVRARVCPSHSWYK